MIQAINPVDFHAQNPNHGLDGFNISSKIYLYISLKSWYQLQVGTVESVRLGTTSHDALTPRPFFSCDHGNLDLAVLASNLVVIMDNPDVVPSGYLT